MSVQNDNTLVTKGDLKTLYSDKIAPYLGGGINYYYTDRSGEELKIGEYTLSGSIPASTSQSTQITISNRTYETDIKRADFQLDNNTIIIPEGTTVKITSYMYLTPGNSSEVNAEFRFRDYANNIDLDYSTASYFGAGYSRAGTWSTVYTAPTGGAKIGMKCTYCAYAKVISNSSRIIVEEVGRIVDPVKYVSNNSDLQETPVGNIISYMGNTVPKHYLACDGTLYSIGTYPELETFIIDEFGSINHFGGNGTTNWAVPDLRGEFLRGTGTNSHAKNGDGANVGVHQNATQISGLNADNSGGIYVTTTSVSSNGFAQRGDGTILHAEEDYVEAAIYNKYRNVAGNRNTNPSNTDGAYTTRPTNTSVKYCIKYESTYHAFFSNATYKVEASFGLSYNSTLQSYVSYSMTYITGDSSLMDGNYFIAPIDGWYIVSFKSNQISYNKPAVQYLQINDVSADAFTDATGSGTSHSNFGVNMTHTIYLSKGDKVNYRVWTNGNTITLPSVRRASFCLLTSNYNPTIVSADSVYSENEQMIGYWKDGKPLYQKSIPFNPAIDISSTTWTNTTISKGDIERITYAEGWVNLSSGYQSRPMIAFVENGASIIKMLSGRDSVGQDTINGVTLRYTKTTDTASALQVENSLLLNRPDLWTPGTEYYFGGGLYGIRKTGTITAAIDERVWTAIVTTSSGNLPSIVDSGGWIKWGDEGTHDYKYSINSTLTGLTGWGNTLGAWSVMRTGDTQIALWNTSGLTRTNAPYDVWVTYRK